MPRLSSQTGLPQIVARKIYKTGQTRGAENDEIFQNRVGRNSTALIPLSQWNTVKGNFPDGSFEKGYIVYAHPSEYFDENLERRTEIDPDLQLGTNLLLHYRLRPEWIRYNPARLGLEFAKSRTEPLRGQYIARVPDTTSENDTQIFEGYTGAMSGGKGAGIRFFEYASSRTLERTRYQLSYLVWHSDGILEICRENGCQYIDESRQHVIDYCNANGLADIARLEQIRVIENGRTICPLCLEPMKAEEFSSRLGQAEGRETVDLTVTRANLFHIEELRPGIFNHCEYNLGWGHHHCNTVVGDMGIHGALEWMAALMRRNGFAVQDP